jgi:hypothetical protein
MYSAKMPFDFVTESAMRTVLPMIHCKLTEKGYQYAGKKY